MATSLIAAKGNGGTSHRPHPGQPRDGLAWPAGLGITVNARPGQTIVIEGDPIDHFYRILSGTVRLYKSIADGRRQVIDFLNEGDVFGLTGLDRQPCSVEAISSVTLIRYPRRSIEAAIEMQPELAGPLFELACAELRRAQRHMLLLGRKTAEERIASFLLELARGSDGGLRRTLRLPMSRLDIADHLGLTIETVSRTFTRFRRTGLIELHGRHDVRLSRIDRLRALAEGEIADAA